MKTPTTQSGRSTKGGHLYKLGVIPAIHLANMGQFYSQNELEAGIWRPGQVRPSRGPDVVAVAGK